MGESGTLKCFGRVIRVSEDNHVKCMRAGLRDRVSGEDHITKWTSIGERVLAGEGLQEQ